MKRTLLKPGSYIVVVYDAAGNKVQEQLIKR